MFWKKKKTDNITIQLDDDDRRTSVRIEPLDTLMLQTREQQFEVLDISASGLSFKSAIFEQSERLDITLLLPTISQSSSDTTVPMRGTIEILHIRNTICHCQFLPLVAEAREQLEQFILAEQKRLIRAKLTKPLE